MEEATLDAPTVRVAATGRIDLNTEKLSLDVLVAPLQTANAILDYVPFLDRIFGGSVLALPVGVTGTLKNPIILPSGSRRRHESRLTDIIGNVLKLPVDAVKIVTPSTASPGESPSGKDLK